MTSRSDFYSIYSLGSYFMRGGNGSLYCGTRQTDDFPVIVKFTSRKNVFSYCDKQLPMEISSLKKIGKLKGCVQLLDWFESSEYFILVFERFYTYKDLFDIISERGYLIETESRKIYKQVIETLIEMKSLQILHGDIKDENILVDLDSNKVKLIDFGSSSILQDEDCTEFFGTMMYAPPEWFQKNRFNDLASCIWSLGILLYTMINGDSPFRNVKQIKEAKIKFKRSCTDECKNLIEKCLSLEPKNRPSLEEILSDSWLRDS